MLTETAIVKNLLDTLGIATVSELLTETDNEALKLVNRRIAQDLWTIDSAQTRALQSSAKLVREQLSFVANVESGRMDTASWLTHYATEVANRMTEIQVAADNIIALHPLRQAILSR